MGASASSVEDKESAKKLLTACIAGQNGEYTRIEECCSSSDSSSKSRKLRNSFEVEKKILARIRKIKHSDESFRMERKMLKQNKNVPIGRSSSPTRESAERDCVHHFEESFNEAIEIDEEDLLKYPQWKSYLEQMEVIPVDSPIIPEAISAGSTPNWFPTVTPSEPLPSPPQSFRKTHDTKRAAPCPDRRPTEVFYHLTILNELDNDLEVTPEQRPTPYQLYMQHRVSDQKSRIIVWMPSKSKQQPTMEKDRESITAQTPPPVLRELKPKPADSPDVKTYRRVNF